MNTKFNDFKLTMDLKPGAYHGSSIRKNISQSLWSKIRSVVLEENNYSCTICGYQPQVEKLRQLHVHEVEEYAKDELLCTLKELKLICAKCHSWHHVGRTFSKLNEEQISDLKSHFMQVNNCSEEDYKNYFIEFRRKNSEAILKQFEEKARTPYVTDLDKLVLYRIDSGIPYKTKVKEQLADKGLYRFFDGEDEEI